LYERGGCFHRYGEEAREAAEKGFGTMHNMGKCAYQLSGLGARGVATKTARLAATNVLLHKHANGSGSGSGSGSLSSQTDDEKQNDLLCDGMSNSVDLNIE
jgi:hypothetical protein